MGLRSRVGDTLVRVGKTFGGSVPESFQRGEEASQMTPASPFSPGTPVGPYDGYDRTPRSRDFVTGYNIATRPRTHERVSFDTLTGLIESYDVAQICCVPSTEVITKRGVIPIEHVVVGDEVITHLGRWRRVTQTMANKPHAPVRTMKTSALEDLSVTGNHPVYAVDYAKTQSNRRVAQGIGWVSADKLRPQGMRDGSRRFNGLVLPALDFRDDTPVLDVAALAGDAWRENGDGMLVRARGGRCTPVPARVRMDAALGRLLGWYLAEGSQARGRTVIFSLGPSERDYAEQILADAEAVFGLRGTIRPNPASSGMNVHVSSSVLGSLFACGNALTKRLPEWAWAGGREFFTALLEGWALGDGCRVQRCGNWSVRVEVATSSRDLAWQMRMIAVGLGLSATIVTMRGREKYAQVIRGRHLNVQSVAYHVAWTEKPRRWQRESFEFGGRYLATALVSAEQSDYDGPVYNLEVEEDESYVTTGGTVHNCIWHRIDSIRSLDWKLVAADGYEGDVTEAIRIGMAVLEEPDRENPFDSWLAKYLYDVLAFDAGTLYRMRNRAGRCTGLRVVDGRTIAPLLDYWGNSPAAARPGDPEPEAFVQYANGLPWNWLTRSDLIYQPFRPVPNSAYGRAPLESIILNANTDIRFQVYFLQRFTEGNLPAAFANSPESWSPDQIEQFQGYWDSFMYGDQSRKHQIRWLPPGSKIVWSNEKDFSDHFSLFMMRKSTAAYHVVPSDLGFTEDVNRSSGESQADVQHRVGDLPLLRKVQRLLTKFLQRDLGLPLKHMFDLGEEQDDRLNQAQADDIYIKNGTVSASYVAEMRFGVADPRPIPRYIFTERAGPVPVIALDAVAGEVDPATALPALDAPLPHTAFTETEGVLSSPPLAGEPLAEQEFGPSAIPPAPPSQPKAPPPVPVAKEAAPAPAAGITAETGIYSYDLDRGEDDEPDEAEVAKELAAFKNFKRKRRQAGEWHDFEFRAVERVCGHNLNDAGRLSVRKAAGEVAVAGLLVRAADTGRVLMLQRALDGSDQ